MRFLLIIMFLIHIFTNLVNSVKDCKRNFSVRNNAIILTKLSLLHGAEFIHKQKVELFQDCYALCCSNPKCTVAVYDNKQHHSCYMFNCQGANGENACLFTEHGHYTAMLEMPNKEQKTRPKVSHQKVESGNKINEKTSTVVTADAGLGEMCGQLRKCGPVNSMCTSGTCICQHGYLGKNKKCVRSVCPKPELMFQCTDTSKMPFCVAIYDRCNGLSECGDGSDEVDCPNKHKGQSHQSNISKPINKQPPHPSKSISDTGIRVSQDHKPQHRTHNTKHNSNNLNSQTRESNSQHTNFPWSHNELDTNPNPNLASESKLGGHYNISPLAEN